jgi:pimeloyl-ACP methyl ester carboxylesterase
MTERMTEYREDRYELNGIDIAVFSAGEGPPLVFFHGGGTATGFDALLPLADRVRLIVPHHPGFGASADDTGIDSAQDYVLLYLDLFDALGLGEVSLVGHSLGGLIASTFAIEQSQRVRKLVLAAPFGLLVPEYPTIDFLSIPPEEVPSYLTADMSVFASLPMPPTPGFLADREREAASLARVTRGRPYDPKLQRWLHRLTMPTLVLWGDADRVIPAEQAAVWSQAIPGAETITLPGVGHLLFDEAREAVDAVGDFVAA